MHQTFCAPLVFSILAHSATVAPVVKVSSTSKIFKPCKSLATCKTSYAPSTLARRSAAFSVCIGAVTLIFLSSGAAPLFSSLDNACASSSAWSYPRFHKVFLCTGTHVIMSNSGKSDTAICSAILRAKTVAIYAFLLNLKRSIASRARSL